MKSLERVCHLAAVLAERALEPLLPDMTLLTFDRRHGARCVRQSCQGADCQDMGS